MSRTTTTTTTTALTITTTTTTSTTTTTIQHPSAVSQSFKRCRHMKKDFYFYSACFFQRRTHILPCVYVCAVCVLCEKEKPVSDFCFGGPAAGRGSSNRQRLPRFNGCSKLRLRFGLRFGFWLRFWLLNKRQGRQQQQLQQHQKQQQLQQQHQLQLQPQRQAKSL